MIDVRMFTVGPVQENCFIVRPQGSNRAVIVDIPCVLCDWR